MLYVCEIDIKWQIAYNTSQNDDWTECKIPSNLVIL